MKLIKYEEGMPLYIICTHQQFDDQSHMMDCLKENGIFTGYSLAFFYSEDWNRDYSPWEADNPVDGSRFAGGGIATMELFEEQLHELMSDHSFASINICGYSLAGLFALWLGLQKEYIDGIVCSSGSMWFENFVDYVKGINAIGSKKVYLSLGGKEKNARNPVMRTIEDRTREVEEILKYKKNILAVKLEMNSGGHFADSSMRMAGGIKWLQDISSHKLKLES